jgi:hypothetical protein
MIEDRRDAPAGRLYNGAVVQTLHATSLQFPDRMFILCFAGYDAPASERGEIVQNMLKTWQKCPKVYSIQSLKPSIQPSGTPSGGNLLKMCFLFTIVQT